MKFLSKHIPGFGRLFLVLFFLVSSGFTVVLYHCTMTDEACQMSCCSGTSHCAAGACGDMNVPRSATPHTITLDQPCRTVTVIGGYRTEPAVVEKDFNGRQILKADLLPSAAYETAICSRLDQPAFHLPSSASNVSTSSVEKYVLNATFLI